MHAQDETAIMLRDSVRRALERSTAAGIAGAAPGGPHWSLFAELGLLGLGVGVDFGGSGDAAVETISVVAELGRAASPEPFIDAIVLAAAAIDRLGTPAQKDRWLRSIVAGELVPGWAHLEPGWRHPFEAPSLRAAPDTTGWTLSGEKTSIATASQLLVVSARLDDSTEVALFALDATREDMQRKFVRTYDGRSEMAVRFDSVPVTQADRLGVGGSVQNALERLLGDALLCECADAVGAMERILDLTVQHLSTREQFGSKLSAFQALQHRVADMHVGLEEARSMLMYASAEWQAGVVNAHLALSALKVQVGSASRFVGEQAVQLHGGVGIAMDYALAPLFLRTTMFASRFGDTEHHLERLINAGGLYS